METHKNLISDYLLIQSDGFLCCGKWSKQYCVVTESKDFQIMSSEKNDAKPIFIGKYEELIDAYKSFAGDVDGSFILVYTDRVLNLRAESDFEMRNWLKYLRPLKNKDFMQKQAVQNKSEEFIPIKDFIEQNKEFWYNNTSQTEKNLHFKDSVTYMTELIEYLTAKKNLDNCKEAMDNLKSFLMKYKENKGKTSIKPESKRGKFFCIWKLLMKFQGVQCVYKN